MPTWNSLKVKSITELATFGYKNLEALWDFASRKAQELKPLINREPDPPLPAERPEPDSPKSNNASQQRVSEIDRLILEAADRYGLVPALLRALIKMESNFDPTAKSKKGAIGLCQLVPETARYLGVDPYDVWQNVDGGAAYLSPVIRGYWFKSWIIKGR